MFRFVTKIFLLLLAVCFMLSPVAAADVGSSQTTVTLVVDRPTEDVVSRIIITADDSVRDVGYAVTLNGVQCSDAFEIAGNVQNTVTVKILTVPEWATPNITLRYNSDIAMSHQNPFTFIVDTHSTATTLIVHLAFDGENPADVPTNPGENPTDTPTRPVNPGTPSVPDIPSTDDPTEPDVPEQPDTPGTDEPGSDTPGSDDYYRPILPPAGFVYNIAGFIPLAAGFLLLFLLFAFRGNLVYRILRKQAKKNGHKPEKETLKATAAGVAALIRNEDLYPEWRKNSETTARLTADISRVLDETHYPPEIPRGIVVARIIKAAKGRINRHRL